MRLILGGAGEVGRGVARALRNEGQDVVLIDADPEAVKEAQGLDAMVLLGDVTRRSTLLEAGISDAGVFIAATGNDERNMLSCALARDILDNIDEDRGREHQLSKALLTIARIHDEGLVEKESEDRLRLWSGVDVAVRPDAACIARLTAGLKSSSLNEVLPLGGDAWIAEVEIGVNASRMASFTLGQAEMNIDGLPKAFTLCRRGEHAIVPDEDTLLEVGDRLVFATIGKHTFKRIAKAAGHEEPPYPDQPRVAIFGATALGRRLAATYLDQNCYVTVLDERLDAANELVGSPMAASKRLDVIHCNLSDIDLLKEVEVHNHDIAIAALEDDHANIAVAMRAADIGVMRTGLVLDDSNLARVVRRIGLTYAVSERRVAVDNILMHVHRRVPGHYQLMPSVPEIVAMSANVSAGHSAIGKTVAELEGRAKGSRIAFVERADSSGSRLMFRANPDMMIKAADRLVLFVAAQDVPKVEGLLEN